MRRRIERKRILFLAILFIFAFSPNVYAVVPLYGNHHNDTDDYCLRADDVKIGTLELQSYETDEERFAAILDAANLEIRIRSKTGELSNPIEKDMYIPDFQQIQWYENLEGYAVTVYVPPIRLEGASEITFLVYVVDDIPKRKMATLSFYGVDIEDCVFDVTDGFILYISDLPVPKKEGNEFLGWYLEPEFKTPFLLVNGEEYAQQEITGDMILYPCWQEVEVLKTEPSETTDIEYEPKSVVEQEIKLEQPAQLERNTVMEVNEEEQTADALETSNQSPLNVEISETKESNNLKDTIFYLTSSCVLLLLVGSIISDINVLYWYRQKKTSED